jgi:hypothetical protein
LSGRSPLSSLRTLISLSKSGLRKMRVIPMTTRFNGCPISVRNLGKTLEHHIRIEDVGTLDRHGRRVAERAPHITNVVNTAQLLKRVTGKYENLLKTISEITNEQDANRIATAHEAELINAIDRINVASSDCEVSANDIPWLLTYAKMLAEDPDAGLEENIDEPEEEEE